MTISWNNIPFAPKRCPFFYGWVIVAVATITTVASVPGQTMGVGVFTDDLILSLGLSRVQLSTAYMIGTIGSSFVLPVAGNLIDRLGVRFMVVIAATGLGLSLVGFSNLERIIKFFRFAFIFGCHVSDDSLFHAHPVFWSRLPNHGFSSRHRQMVQPQTWISNGNFFSFCYLWFQCISPAS